MGPRQRSRALVLSLACALATALTFATPDVAKAAVAKDPWLPLPPLPSLALKDDPFYEVPSPLPAGKPGDVIKAKDIGLSTYPVARATKLMYLSTNNRRQRVAVTGLLLTPRNQRPGTANPLVVHTPGTRGLADHCAPSRQADLLAMNASNPEYSILEYQQFLLRGIAVVVTDYVGTGTAGDPEYLVGRPAGYNGLDALRAAMQVPGSGVSLSSPVGISGFSQGGQAAGWAGELQPSYAPELRLEGILAVAAPADMRAEIQHLNGDVLGAELAVAAIIGLDRANPQLRLESRLTPVGRRVVDNVKRSCGTEGLLTHGFVRSSDITAPDVLESPTWQKAFDASRLGKDRPGAPVYMIHGKLDTLVPYAQGHQLYRDWCQRGADVTFETLPLMEHLTSHFLGSSNGVDWLTQRLRGAPAATGCRKVGLR